MLVRSAILDEDKEGYTAPPRDLPDQYVQASRAGSPGTSQRRRFGPTNVRRHREPDFEFAGGALGETESRSA